MRRVYIAGRVTGVSPVIATLIFRIAEGRLYGEGYKWVSNPLNIVPYGTEWPEAMRMCIKAMMECDTIYMLSNWKKSRGARVEHRIAKSIGMKIIYEK